MLHSCLKIAETNGLDKLYECPPRRHSNWQHVLAAIKIYEAVKPLSQRALLVAWLYHDAICRPELGYQYNVDQNVWLYLNNAAKKYDVSSAEMDEYVKALTKVKGINTGPVADLERLIFTVSPDDYKAYRTNIRAEHWYLTAAAWAKGRKNALAAILSQPSIYWDRQLENNYGTLARQNLAGELIELES